MIPSLDLEQIFNTARQSGVDLKEIYLERVYSSDSQLNEKDCSTEFNETGGVSLTLTRGDVEQTLRSSQLSTEGILALFNPQIYRKHSELKTQNFYRPDIFSFKKRSDQLTSFARKLSFENALTHPVELHYFESQKFYQIIQSPTDIKEGQEECMEFDVNLGIEKKGRRLDFKIDSSHSDISAFPNVLSNLTNSLKQRVNQRTPDPWPAPQGKMPILWSHTSFAKILHTFTRAFEGDLVLKDRSFLNRLDSNFELEFELHEHLSPVSSRFDHEGSEKMALPIFDGKRPRSLATDLRTAQEFSVNSTGHSRRENYHKPSTIVFWNPTLTGKKVDSNLLGQLKEGIWIEDLELLYCDLSRGILKIRVNEAYLIHLGATGESIEPVEWEIDLIDFLPTLKCFGDEKETTGILTTKAGNRLLTELTTPEALSDALHFPGTVPKNHYW